MNFKVVIEKISSNRKQLIDQFTRSFSVINLTEKFNSASSVFIKPNLTYPVFKPGVTTRKEFIECLVAALREINAKTTIYIGEGEGGYNSFSMDKALQTMGFLELEKIYPNVKVVNLSKLPTKKITLNTTNGEYLLKLPAIFFDSIDFSISCPLPKVHCMTKLTLAFKNQWGCIPDTMRLKNHYIFDSLIPRITETLKFKYAFLDGLYGLDDNGPMTGTPVKVDWFAAANSLGAFDRTVSSLMGFDYKSIGHLRIAEKYDLIPSEQETEITGNPENFKKKFTLKRNFWNYPALVAFHSKHLTHLLYFSMWSRILHDIMYTFRQRPISESDHCCKL